MTLWMTSLTGYDAGWRGDGAQGEDVGLGVGGGRGRPYLSFQPNACNSAIGKYIGLVDIAKIEARG